MPAPKVRAPKKVTATASDEDVLPSASAEDGSEEGQIEEGVEEVSAEEVAAEAASDLVKIVAHQTINPAPTVGTVNLVRDFGIEKLVERETYNIPRCVAEVLVDRRKASIV